MVEKYLWNANILPFQYTLVHKVANSRHEKGHGLFVLERPGRAGS